MIRSLLRRNRPSGVWPMANTPSYNAVVEDISQTCQLGGNANQRLHAETLTAVAYAVQQPYDRQLTVVRF